MDIARGAGQHGGSAEASGADSEIRARAGDGGTRGGRGRLPQRRRLHAERQSARREHPEPQVVASMQHPRQSTCWEFILGFETLPTGTWVCDPDFSVLVLPFALQPYVQMLDRKSLVQFLKNCYVPVDGVSCASGVSLRSPKDELSQYKLIPGRCRIGLLPVDSGFCHCCRRCSSSSSPLPISFIATDVSLLRSPFPLPLPAASSPLAAGAGAIPPASESTPLVSA